MTYSAKVNDSGMTLSRFANEILAGGARSVLPQNLSTNWLDRLQKMADNFLDTSFEGKSCSDPADTADPILAACVTEIIGYQKGTDPELSKEELVEKTAIYCIALTIETLRRQSIVDIDPPNLEDIFSRKRLEELEGLKPELGKFYKKVCIGTRKKK